MSFQTKKITQNNRSDIRKDNKCYSFQYASKKIEKAIQLFKNTKKIDLNNSITKKINIITNIEQYIGIKLVKQLNASM